MHYTVYAGEGKLTVLRRVLEQLHNQAVRSGSYDHGLWVPHSQLRNVLPELIVVVGDEKVNKVRAVAERKPQCLPHEWCAPNGCQPRNNESLNTGLEDGLK